MNDKKQSTGTGVAPDAGRNPLDGCILEKRAREGEVVNYSYPDNGLPEVTVDSAPAWSPFPDPDSVE